MSFKESILTCFRKYANFSGRARRSEFWFFQLFQSLVNTVTGLLTAIVTATVILADVLPLALQGRMTDGDLEAAVMTLPRVLVPLLLIMLLCYLVLLIPNLAVTWRRLHDIGKSGSWFFIGLVPLVGQILLLLWLCRESEPVDNRFGPCPGEGDGMTLKEAVRSCFRKYATFSGRARRSEYWFFVLFVYLVEYAAMTLYSTVINAVSSYGLLAQGEAGFQTLLAGQGVFMLFGILLWIVFFLPTLAVTWRRLHDIGKGGGCFFFSLVPLVGPILLLVWLCRDSQPEENRFGPCPKAPPFRELPPWEYT